jgi:pyruvate formate lyase activating enzyme
MHEAILYQKLNDQKVHCFLCRHGCTIEHGRRGICAVRENRDGSLYTLVYGKLISTAVDPIEKKPIFHMKPGSRSFSIATVGCNFHCLFCQNSNISQLPREQTRILGQDTKPGEVVDMALRTGCHSISYTYTEPTIAFEFNLETARLANAQGLRNVFVTNGYMSREALQMISPYLDAANVDLKAFTEEFYSKQCGAHLQGVLENLRLMKEMGIWIEVTTLMIPGLNDSPLESEQIARFIMELSPDVPWHISRFHPMYRLIDRPSTPLHILKRARDIGLKVGLRYVYTGNVPGDEGEHTFCHGCGRVVVERLGFSILNNKIREGRCSFCGATVPGLDM